MKGNVPTRIRACLRYAWDGDVGGGGGGDDNVGKDRTALGVSYR